jgi:hypothetical protein
MLITGGRVFQHDGDPHHPPLLDILIQHRGIASMTMERAFAEQEGLHAA